MLIRSVRLAGVILSAAAILYFWARHHYSGTPPPALPGESCDGGLWSHVYRPKRLRILSPCTSVVGRVVSLQREEDGDLHIDLEPDDASVLNLVNAMHGGRHLVAEIVCEHAPERDDIKAVCAGLAQGVAAPAVGERVRVTGSFVTDRESGWNEVHPVARIDKLR